MNKINAVDRVPTQVLQNGARRYGIYNSSGVLQEYVYIKKEDEPSVAGTPIDKTLFDKIDTNMEEIDGKANMGSKYVSAILSSTGTDTIQDDLLPESTDEWDEITTGLEYVSWNGQTLTADSVSNATNYSVLKAVDRDDATQWRSATGTGGHYMLIDFGQKVKITKVKGKFVAYSPSTASARQIYIQGSNDNENWVNLFSQTSADSSAVEKTLTTTGYYRYYRVYYGYSNANAYLYVSTFQITEFEQTNHYLTMSLGLTAYEIGQRVLMKTPSGITDYGACYLNIDNLGNKLVGIMTPSSYKELVLYNQNRFIILR